jgi:type II secretory pathway pseudopilin PulG
MAPTQLHPRAQITTQGYILIISLASIVICAIFCTVVLCLICRTKRKRAKRQQAMNAEQRVPFVAQPYQTVQDDRDGPIELQGGDLGAKVYQLDGESAMGYGARPVEMPAYGVKR